MSNANRDRKLFYVNIIVLMIFHEARIFAIVECKVNVVNVYFLFPQFDTNCQD